MRDVDAVSGRIIGAAIRVHKRFGPGLLESVYKSSLGHELVAEGLQVELEKPIRLKQDGQTIRSFVIDVLVEGLVIVEVKSVRRLATVHASQLLTYLKVTGLEVGLILNFNVPRLVDGIKRVVNDYKEEDETTT
jgi:iron complex transport system substrate-binding protein